MLKITATELARQLRSVLDRVQHRGEAFTIVRNNQVVAHLFSGPAQMTALEAMSDIYRTLPEDAAKDWIAESRTKNLRDKIKDPWES